MHNDLTNATMGAMFVIYWPFAYKLSRTVSPATWMLGTAAWCAAYQYGAKPMLLSRMQSNLNAFASQYAEKYGHC